MNTIEHTNPEAVPCAEPQSTQKPARRKLGVFFALFCLFAAAAAAVYNYFLLANSDSVNIDGIYDAVLYKNGAATVCFFILCAVIAVVLGSSFFFFRKTKPREPSKCVDIVNSFACSAAGLMLIAVVALQFILKSSLSGTQYELTKGAFSIQSSSSMQKISLVLAGVSSLYFLLPLFIEKQKMKIPHIALGLVCAFFFCTQLLVRHNFMSDFLSSPTRIFSMCTYCFLIFFILADVRMHIEERIAPGNHAASALIAFFVAFTESVPELILSFSGKTGFTLGLDSFYLILKLVVGIYAFNAALPTLMSTEKRPAAENAKTAELCDPQQEEAKPQSAPEPEEESDLPEEPAQAPETKEGN